MIRHQQFKKRFARTQNFFGIGDYFHAGLDGTDAGGRKHSRSRVNDAKAADTNRRLILQVTQRGNTDAVHASGIEYCCSIRHANAFAVDDDFDKTQRCGRGRHARGVFPRAALHQPAKPR